MTGGLPGDGCEIIPMPILLAEPSRPRAIIVVFVSVSVLVVELDGHQFVFGWLITWV